MSVELVPPQSDRVSISLKAQAPHIQQLIQDSIEGFLKDIVFEKAFPLPKEKRAMAINVLMENARHLGLHDIATWLGHDMKYAKQLAILPEGRLATWRQNFKRNTQPIVISGYELTRNTRECREHVTKLIKYDGFIYPTNLQGNATSWHEPFQHLVILDILRASIFNGPTSLGLKYQDHFVSVLDDHEDEPELPSDLVAFVATSVYSMLADWRIGSGPSDDTVSFVADEYHQVYDKFQRMLHHIYTSGEDGLKKYHVLLSQMYQKVRFPTESIEDEQTFSCMDLDNMAIGDEAGESGGPVLVE
ncbi:hypothetical protein V8E55_004141 [Tylopilus felleus]